MKLGSEGGRVMVKLERNIVVRVRQWRFVRKVSGLEVPRGLGLRLGQEHEGMVENIFSKKSSWVLLGSKCELWRC